MEDWRIKISVLWLCGFGTAITTIVLEFYEPGVIDQIRSGEKEELAMGPEYLILLSILLLIPLAMAFLSQILKEGQTTGRTSSRVQLLPSLR